MYWVSPPTLVRTLAWELTEAGARGTLLRISIPLREFEKSPREPKRVSELSLEDKVADGAE